MIDATANLQISNDSKHHHQQQQHHNQKQQPQQQQQRNANFEEIQFPYNPYKIMGFQNKETNEFAMNVLKMGDQKLSHAGAAAASAPNNNLYVNNSLNNVANAPSSQANLKHSQKHMAAMPPQQQQQQPQPPPQQQIPQIVSVQAPMAPAPKHANYLNQSVPPPHAYAPQPQHAPQQQAPYNMWTFNVGDRCLAKYWEDEKYYNAEIQAVTDKTCVVHFPEYGNVEEVLRTDCLPITDANHQPINHGFSGLAAPAPTLPHPIAYTALPPNKGGGPPMPPQPTHFHQPYHSRELNEKKLNNEHQLENF